MTTESSSPIHFFHSFFFLILAPSCVSANTVDFFSFFPVCHFFWDGFFKLKVVYDFWYFRWRNLQCKWSLAALLFYLDYLILCLPFHWFQPFQDNHFSPPAVPTRLTTYSLLNLFWKTYLSVHVSVTSLSSGQFSLLIKCVVECDQRFIQHDR